MSEKVDIEILSLLLGTSYSSKITGVSKEIIQSLLGRLNPEDHSFFTFMKDCVLQLASKIGIEDTAKKLELSVPVVKSIVKYSPLKLDIIKRPATEEKTAEENENLKDIVLDYYNRTNSVSKTSKKFNISRETVVRWVVSAEEFIKY